MSKRNRGTNIMDLIAKGAFYASAGRIRWRSNMWAIINGRWDRGRLVNPCLGELVKDDHVLVCKPCTLCPCAPEDGFWFDGKWWWVAAVVCRKCQWHRASGRNGFRFPRCTYGRAADAPGVAAETLVQVSGIVREAQEQAEKIAGGGVSGVRHRRADGETVAG